MISEEAKKKYLDGGGLHCPYCNSYRLDADPVKTDDCNTYVQDVICEDCGKMWRDTLSVTGVEEIDDR